MSVNFCCVGFGKLTTIIYISRKLCSVLWWKRNMTWNLANFRLHHFKSINFLGCYLLPFFIISFYNKFKNNTTKVFLLQRVHMYSSHLNRKLLRSNVLWIGDCETIRKYLLRHHPSWYHLVMTVQTVNFHH